jgi:hypothetical protein
MSDPSSQGLAIKASAQAIENFVRSMVLEIRHGRREGALFILVVITFAAAFHGVDFFTLPSGVAQYKEPVRLALYVLGGGLFVWAIARIWVQATPRKAEAAAVKPSAIKGPMAFGQADGELFQRLHRQNEIERLLSFVLDEQIGLVVVTGESGAGKTSLLRAGLSHALKSRDISLVYWEARPSQPLPRLLTTIDANLAPAGKKLFDSLESLMRAGDLVDQPRAIVLGQFEQLHPSNNEHRPIFELLRHVGKEVVPPYRITWIVAFRRDYGPEWREFEIENEFDARMLPIRLFGKAQARAVMTTLGDASKITLENDLVDDMVDAAAQGDTVSPVDIGIGMLVLQDLAARTNKPHLALKDYRFAGGAEGVLTEYVRESLQRVSETDHDAILKALIALADLNTNQRIADGRTCGQLSAEAGLPQRVLRRHLDFLASPHIRLLEAIPAREDPEPRYRLPHERLIPSLRRLTGRFLADVDQAQLALDSAYHAWVMNKKKRRYLLLGTDLRSVTRQRPNLLLGENAEEKNRFIDRSIRRRNMILGASMAAVPLIAVSAYFGLHRYTEYQHRNYLKALNLPRDLFDFQAQLTSLRIERLITELDWLRADGLKSLRIESKVLTSLNGLPDLPNLQTLDLGWTAISSLAGLPTLPRLQTLDVSGTQITSLAGLPDLPSLQSLDLSGTEITSLAGLPALPSLQALDLGRTEITSLAGLPALPSLQTLDLGRTEITSLAGLPDLPSLRTLIVTPGRLSRRPGALSSLEGLPALPSLQTLDVSDTQITSLAGLPALPSLQTLDLSGTEITSLAGLPALPSLLTLDLGGTEITRLAGLPKLPSLQTLDLGETQITSLAGLPDLPSLQALIVARHTRLPRAVSLSNLKNLPALRRLQALNLGGTEITSLAGLPALPSLQTLDVGETEITSLAGLPALPSLQTLDVSANQIASLEGLPALTSLQILNLGYTQITSLAGLPELPSLQTLDLGGTAIASLAGLPDLPSLQTLNLSRTNITSLAGLPKLPSLQTLDLGETQISSLAGLSDLPSLQTLTVAPANHSREAVPLSSLAGLPELPGLRTLDLSEAGITSLAGLPTLPRLQTLDLSGTEITSLAGLPTLPTLQTLDLSGTEITSLAGLPTLPRLQTLDLRGTAIASLAGLPALPRLQTLDVSGTQITSLEGLRELPGLQTLNVNDTQIAKLAGMPELPSLQTLDLGETRITSLAGLPVLQALKEVIFGGYGLASLKGLPPTVQSLEFYGDPREDF